MPVKFTFFFRSGVIDIEAMMASYFFASRAGMIPSQSCLTSSHSTFICSHRASAISMSKPFNSPDGVVSENGG